MKINWHRVVGALAVGGATAAGALSGGTIPAVVAGLSAAIGTLVVKPSQISKATKSVARKLPGIKGATGTAQLADPEDPPP
jgi:hypothetical protein